MKFTRRFRVALLASAVFLTGLAAPPSAPAQTFDLANLLVQTASGLGGYLIGKTIAPHNGGLQAGLGVGGALLGNFGYGYYQKKEKDKILEAYLHGRNDERWAELHNYWYQSTLDPTTGRPPAFSGLNAMDDGLPNRGRRPPPNSYGAPEGAPQPRWVPMRLPAGVYNGVPRTERIIWVPKLP
jgi:hypothetical protein